jgi:hypothetical protein
LTLAGLTLAGSVVAGRTTVELTVAGSAGAELAPDDPLVLAFSRAVSLAFLQRRHPCYDVWAELHHGRSIRYVAQRMPGMPCRPYAVVTTDPAELDAALTQRS